VSQPYEAEWNTWTAGSAAAGRAVCAGARPITHSGSANFACRSFTPRMREGREYEPASVLLERIRAERESAEGARANGERRRRSERRT
jgi:hypothetical protein